MTDGLILRLKHTLAIAALLLAFAVPTFAGDAVLVPTQPDIAGILSGVNDQTQPLFERVLALNKVQEPELDVEQCRDAFKTLLEKSREAVAKCTTPQEKVAALNRVLLTDRDVSYVSNKYWRDATLAASLVRGKGNCVSTSTLYVAIGAALQLPIKMVLIPRHAFARWDDGKTQINIETTSGGVNIPDAEYFRRMPIAAEDKELLGWGRCLDYEAFLAELLVIAAHHREGENKLADAVALLEQAGKVLPHRSDYRLQRYQLMADMTNQRGEARLQVLKMLQEPLPPSVETHALMYLAASSAGEGDHEMARKFYMHAFARAPKSSQSSVLTRLAFCLRALKDTRGALRYMELAALLDPDSDAVLYNLAILQKTDHRLGDAIETIRKARKINAESWNLHILEAGYLILDGKRDEGLKLFETLEKPRGDVDFWEIMLSWFFAASQQRDKFFPQFERALSMATSTQIFEWIDQDVDLDIYRNEAQFKELVAKHRKRLFADLPPKPTPTPADDPELERDEP